MIVLSMKPCDDACELKRMQSVVIGCGEYNGDDGNDYYANG
jgi:hypothetical protein